MTKAEIRLHCLCLALGRSPDNAETALALAARMAAFVEDRPTADILVPTPRKPAPWGGGSRDGRAQGGLTTIGGARPQGGDDAAG